MALKPAYFAKEAVTNLRRNLLMALAATIAVAVSLALLGAAGMFVRVVDNVSKRWANDVQINAFLRDDASEAQIAAARRTAEDWGEVRRVDFISKKDAYDEFREMFSNQQQLVETVTPETLPASFRVALKDPDTLPVVQERLEKLAGVEDVVSAKEEVARVQRVLNVVTIVVVVFTIVLLIAAIVLISNTIRLAIFSRRKEIGIMKLVGATNWFIRWPFMIEGLVQGLMGAVLAIVILWAGKELIVDAVARSVPFLPVGIPNSWMALVFLAMAIVGGLVAVSGTTLALRRHLDV